MLKKLLSFLLAVLITFSLTIMYVPAEDEVSPAYVLIEEDFSESAENFGFEMGSQTEEGKLTLTKDMESGTASVKAFGADVINQTTVSLSFDWMTDVTADEKSGIELRDMYGRLIFALAGKDGTTLLHATSGSDSDSTFLGTTDSLWSFEPVWTETETDLSKTYTVNLTLDFEGNKASYSIFEKDSVTPVAEVTDADIKGSNLAKMVAANYVGGTQYIDNFVLSGAAEASLPLRDKTIYCFGDSIVDGHNYPAAGFVQFTALKNGMTVAYDGAQNGWRIVTTPQIVTQVTSAPAASPDFVIFTGGLNDAYSTTDIATFESDFRTLALTIYEKWPTSKIIYVAAHKTLGRDASVQANITNAAKEVCDELNIYVADIYSSDLDCTDTENRQKYIFDVLGYDNLPGTKETVPESELTSSKPSGTHPNFLGIEEYYVPLVTEALLEADSSNSCAVAFDANGGSIESDVLVTDEDGKIETLPVPTHSEGYLFEGWYTEAEGGEKVTVDTVFSEYTTIYAHWIDTGIETYENELVSEDFSSSGNFGFSTGVSVSDGWLSLANSADTTSIKVFDATTINQSAVSLSFDWRTDVTTEERSGIELRDMYGRLIFAIAGEGGTTLCHATTGSDSDSTDFVSQKAAQHSVDWTFEPEWNEVSADLSKTYNVVLCANFENKVVSYLITEKESGSLVASITDASIRATDFSRMISANYKGGNQYIDNFCLMGKEGEVSLPLSGKTIYAFGDGYIDPPNYGKNSFVDFVALKNGMTVAYDGAYYSNRLVHSTYTVKSKIKDAPEDAPDFIIFTGGVHQDLKDKNGDLDGFKTQFTEGLEELVEAMQTKWPTAKLVYVIPHKFPSSSGRSVEGQEFVRETAPKIMAEYGGCVCDIAETGFDATVDSLGNYRKTYTFDYPGLDDLPSRLETVKNGTPQGIIPNFQGIETFYLPKVTETLLSISYVDITFDANGGTVTEESATTEASGKLATLPTPSHDGSYYFDGWYTEAEGGEKVTIDTVFSSATTIYAHWIYANIDTFSNELVSEDFSSLSGNYGFSAGALISDKALLLTSEMDSDTAGVKLLGADIINQSAVSVSFDWKSNAATGEKSGIELRDMYGRLIFAIAGEGGTTLCHATTGSDSDSGSCTASFEPGWNKVSMDLSKTYEVLFKADFENNKVSYSVTEKESGNIVVYVSDATIKASELSYMIAANYDGGAQKVDNLLVCGKEGEVSLPLRGKTIYSFGDGYVDPANYYKNGFVDFTAIKNGMTVTHDGAINAHRITTSNVNIKILNQVNNAPSSAPDFVIFTGGVHADVKDMTGSKTEEQIATFKTNFKADFEILVSTMKEKWPTAKLVYVMPHKIPNSARSLEGQEFIRATAIEIMAKYGGFVSDIAEAGFDATILDNNGKKQYTYDNLGTDKLPSTLETVTTGTPTGTLPNFRGVEKYYVPTVTATLVEILNTEEKVTIKVDSVGGFVTVGKPADPEGEGGDVVTGDQTIKKDTPVTYYANSEENSTFKYWIEVNTGKIIPADKDNAITLSGAVGRNVRAVFAAPPEGERFVSFYGKNGTNVIGSGYVGDGKTPAEAEIVPSDLKAYVSAHELRGWKKDGKGEVLSADELGTDGTDYYAVYEKVGIGSYKLTLGEGASIVQSYDLNAIPYGITVTVKAAGKNADEEPFMYWKQNEEIVSYDLSYAFIMPASDITMIPVYGNEATEVVSIAMVVNGEEKDNGDGTKMAGFMITRTVPEGTNVIDTGIIYVRDSAYGDLTIESVGKTAANGKAVNVSLSTNKTSGQYKFNARYEVSTGIKAVAFITYEVNGETITVYSLAQTVDKQ